VDRDSMPLHVLAGVPETVRKTIAEVLKAEPALWEKYGGWLSAREPAIWQEIILMAAQQNQQVKIDARPWAPYLDPASVKSFVEAVGVKQTVEAVGVKETVEAVGVKQVLEAMGGEQLIKAMEEQFGVTLSPEQREKLLRSGQPAE
jgi:hypothetical protein